MRIRAACCICFLALPLAAQFNTGTILGSVMDPSGAAVAGVKVNAVNTQTNRAASGVTVASGEYRIFDLPVGTYAVTVEQQGFKKVTLANVVVVAYTSTRVDVQLEIGSVSQEVTVSAQVSQVDTNSGQFAQTVDDKQIADLPIQGRNTAALVVTLPGVHDYGTQNSQGFMRSDLSAGGTWYQNRSTEWLLDGGIHTATYTNYGDMLPNTDAVQEFQFTTSQRSAEFGRVSGAFVNVVTKSGTNEFHGAGFEFLRNSDLDARSYGQAVGNPKDVRNQFGGVVGGPILKNRTFFFTDYQRFEQRQNGFTLNQRLFTDLERQGNFSQSTLKPKDPTTNAPYPGNTLPASLLSPISALILAKVPLAGSTGIWSGVAPSPYTQWEFMQKIDHNIGSRHRISGSYFAFKDLYSGSAGSSVPIPGYTNFGGNALQSSLNAIDTFIISPTMLNSLQATYNRVDAHRGFASTETLQQMGSNFTQALQSPRPPYLTISGYFTLDATNDGVNMGDTKEFKDTLRWTRGRHNFSFGGTVINYMDKSYTGPGPQVVFNGAITGNQAADFLLGDVYSFSYGVPNNTNLKRHWLYGAFIQDDWKASRRLTLNLGFRWEDLTGIVNPNDYMLTFHPGVQSVVFPSAPVGMLFKNPFTGATDPGWNRSGYHAPQAWNPRFGFAYDVFGTGKTAVRGGIGIYASEIQSQSYGSGIQNPLAAPSPGTLYMVPFSNPYVNSFDPIKNAVGWTPGPTAQPVFPSPYSLSATDPNTKRPYVIDYSFGIQQQLPRNTYLNISFVGNGGRRMWFNYELYPAEYKPGATVANIASRIPYYPGTYSKVYMNGTPGTMNYQALQLHVNRRFKSGLSFSTAYTFSKTLDTNSYPPVDFGNMKNEYGRADDDRTHVAVVTGIWEPQFLKFHNRILDFTLGHWQFSGILTLESGFPVTVRTGTDNLMNSYTGERPLLVADPNLDPHRSRSAAMAEWFNTAAFVNPGLGIGGVGRNLFDGPGLKNLDSAMTKIFRITERYRVQYRWEMFDACNWVNIGMPLTYGASNSNLQIHNAMNDPQFGQITGAGPMRVMQMSLKFVF